MSHHQTDIAIHSTTISAVLALLDHDTNDSDRQLSLTFSCNPKGEVWRFAGYGHTPTGKRDPVTEPAGLLAAILTQYLRRHPRGGRFRLDADSLSLVAAADGNPFLVLRIELS